MGIVEKKMETTMMGCIRLRALGLVRAAGLGAKV